MKQHDESKNDTVFLRFIAILLILNSHLDAYYPIKYLGTGGAIGNTLFFILSSFGLLISQQSKPQNFQSWFSKRVGRIYPSACIVALLLLIPIKIFYNLIDFVDLNVLTDFFFPPFWFLRALIVFYFLGWFIIKDFTTKKWYIAAGLSVLLYIYFYIFHLDHSSYYLEELPFKVFYYFIAFLFGIILAHKNRDICYDGKRDYSYFLLSILVMYTHKVLFQNGMFEDLQCIQQLACLVAAYYLFKISKSPLIKEKLMNSVVSVIIKYISSITLELYMVHVVVSPIIMSRQLPFPLSVVVFLIFTVLLAAIIKSLSTLFFSQKYFKGSY